MTPNRARHTIRRPRWLRRPSLTAVAAAALLVIALTLLAFVYVFAADRTAERDEATGTAVGLAQQVDAACAAGGPAADDLGDLCDQAQQIVEDPAVVVEPGPPGPTGPAGPQGQQGDGPTPEQVAAAVAAYCAGGRCAAPPSDPQVTAAVVAYCSAGRCTGATGSTGSTGATGATGQAGQTGGVGPAGPQGPGPTTEQVRAAVDAYCAENGCTGPQGATGQTGRGIASLACQSTPLTGTTRITVTYDDGTSQTVDCTT